MPASSDIIKNLTQHKDAPQFSFDGINTWALVVDLHDLDTLQCVFCFSGVHHRFSIRVNGVDSPEMIDKNPVVKDWAVKARNRMLSLISPGSFHVTGQYTRKDIKYILSRVTPVVFLNLYEFDKYGRILADVRSEPDSPVLTECLLHEGYCKPYGICGNLTKSSWLPADCKSS